MNTVLEFLKAEKTGLWWWVALLKASLVVGVVALVFFVVVLVVDATMLSERATAIFLVAIVSALIAGIVFGGVEYERWKNPSPQPTKRHYNW